MSAITRHSFTLRVAAGKEAEYRQRHDEIWPDLVALQQRAGVRNFTLFQRGTDVVGYFEHDASQAVISLAEFESEQLVRRWNKHMADIIESFGGKLLEVWHA
ncbi:L-rhamnose mutarotase [Aeromicrobium sp.]|uniref:L-rhamnose mutarotase n=1 Tax=Aeromicrobium sp. TaxID=1871063 RepID=UPI002FC89029